MLRGSRVGESGTGLRQPRTIGGRRGAISRNGGGGSRSVASLRASGDVLGRGVGMATGTAQLLFGAAHRTDGGLIPYWSLWLYEDRRGVYWRTESGPKGPVSWVPRTSGRLLPDALVLLVALASTPRDPVPVALTEMSGGIPWDEGHVDVSTWRHYDAALLDALVAQTEPAGKLVLSILSDSSLSDLEVLAGLDWDHDVLVPAQVRRRADRDLHQAPPPRLGAPLPDASELRGSPPADAADGEMGDPADPAEDDGPSDGR